MSALAAEADISTFLLDCLFPKDNFLIILELAVLGDARNVKCSTCHCWRRWHNLVCNSASHTSRWDLRSWKKNDEI